MSDEKRRIIGGEFAISHELTISNSTDLQTADNAYYYSSGRCALFAILNDIKHTFGKSGGYCSQIICATQLLIRW